MAYSFAKFKSGVDGVLDHLAKEFAAIRTGRATPALLDSINVESYGSRVPLKQLGSVGVDDVRSLRITLWDKSQVKAVEQAISVANLGVSVTVDGPAIRVIFPDLTAEKRKLLSKVAGEKAEAARIALRQEREKTWNEIQAGEQDGTISEDEKFRLKEDLQAQVDEVNQKIKSALERKEAEIAG